MAFLRGIICISICRRHHMTIGDTMNSDYEQHWDNHENNENTELEIVDLAPQEAHGMTAVAVALIDFSLRIFARVRSVRNAFSASALDAPSPTRKWQHLRVFSPFTCLLLLKIGR